MKKYSLILPIFAIVLFTTALSFGLSALAQTFSEPAGAPPSNNAYAPLDTSSTTNDKPGTLGLDHLLSRFDTYLATNSGNVAIGTTIPIGTLDVENSNKTATICLNGTCTSNLSSSAGGAPVLSAIRSYTTSGAWSKPPNLVYAVVKVWGGGGGGGLTIRDGYGDFYGGGAGGFAMKVFPASSLSASSYQITIGDGGIGATDSGTVVSGSSGGTSSFGTLLSASGGSAAGISSDGMPSGGGGGSGYGGDVNLIGGDGKAGLVFKTSSGGSISVGGDGGDAPMGGGVGGDDQSTYASLSQVPGGGGGGSIDGYALSYALARQEMQDVSMNIDSSGTSNTPSRLALFCKPGACGGGGGSIYYTPSAQNGGHGMVIVYEYTN